MRYYLFAIALCFNVGTYGEDAKENMKQLAFENPFHSSSQQYLTISNFSNYRLEEFMKYDWASAEILGRNGELLELDSVNFYLPDQKMIFLNEGKLLELYPDQIEKIKINRTFYAPFKVYEDKEIALRFFEVLGGSNFKVLKTTRIKEEAKRVHSMGMKSSETKLVRRDRFFYVPENNNLAIPIPGSKSKFLKTFKRHKKKMINFLHREY